MWNEDDPKYRKEVEISTPSPNENEKWKCGMSMIQNVEKKWKLVSLPQWEIKMKNENVEWVWSQMSQKSGNWRPYPNMNEKMKVGNEDEP